MTRKHGIIRIILLLALLTGCYKAEVQTQPEVSFQTVMTQYLTAIKQQDEQALASMRIDATPIDFKVSESEAETLGMSIENAQKFYQKVMAFEDEIIATTDLGDEATCEVHIKTYDISRILADAVAAHEEEFQKINEKDLSDTEKNDQIADILLASFEQANRTYEFQLTFTLKKTSEGWKVSKVEDAFFQLLFSSTEE